MSEPRISSITVGIKRLLNTAQYENVEVRLEATEQVTWSSPDERTTKITSLTRNITEQYKDTQTQVLHDLGIEEKRAWMKYPAAKVNQVGDALEA